jgi:hypothetical protein
MEATGYSVADFDPCHPVANGCHFIGAIGQSYHPELGLTTTATFKDHQIAVVKRARADATDGLASTQRLEPCGDRDLRNRGDTKMEAYRIDRFGSVDGIVLRSSDDPRPGLREILMQPLRV